MQLLTNARRWQLLKAGIWHHTALKEEEIGKGCFPKRFRLDAHEWGLGVKWKEI